MNKFSKRNKGNPPTIVILIFMTCILYSLSLLFIKDARADGTGTFVTGNGTILTNRHVVIDGVKDKKTTFYVGYQGVFYPAKIVSISVTADLALLKIEADTTCLNIKKVEIKSQLELRLMAFNLLDGKYENFDNKKTFFNLTVKKLNQYVLGQVGFSFEPWLRPGNSGSPILDSNSNIVSVGFAGLNLGEFNIESYGLNNDVLIKFIKSNNDVVCYFPDTRKPTESLVWIYAV